MNKHFNIKRFVSLLLAAIILLSTTFSHIVFAQSDDEYTPVTLSMFSNRTDRTHISGYLWSNDHWDYTFFVSICDLMEISGGFYDIVIDPEGVSWHNVNDKTIYVYLNNGLREFVIYYRTWRMREPAFSEKADGIHMPVMMRNDTFYVSALDFLNYIGATVQLDRDSSIQLKVAIQYNMFDAMSDYLNMLHGGFFWWDQIESGNISIETRLTVSGVIALINRDSNIFRMMFNPSGIQQDAIESVLLTILMNEGERYFTESSFALNFAGILSDANEVQGDIVKFITEVYKTDANAAFGEFLGDFSQYAGMAITPLLNAVYAIEAMRKFEAVTESQRSLLENTIVRYGHRSSFLEEQDWAQGIVNASNNINSRVANTHDNYFMAAQDAARATAWSFASSAAAVSNPVAAVWTYTNMIVGRLPVIGSLIQGHVQMSNAYYASMIQLAANDLLVDAVTQMQRTDFRLEPEFQYDTWRRIQDAMALQIKATLTTREFLILSNQLTDARVSDMEAVNVMVAGLLNRVQMAEIPRVGAANIPLPDMDIGWIAEFVTPDFNEQDIIAIYYEFLYQRGFEAYVIHDDWWTHPFNRYAIIDIDGDGIPELIVSSFDGFGWFTDLIFTFDIHQGQISFISSLFTLHGLSHSQQHGALVFEPLRTHVGAGLFEFHTLDDLKNRSISFTLSFDEGSEFNPAHNTIIYGEWHEENRLTRNISETERSQYLNELVWIEYSYISLSSQPHETRNTAPSEVGNIDDRITDIISILHLGMGRVDVYGVLGVTPQRVAWALGDGFSYRYDVLKDYNYEFVDPHGLDNLDMDGLREGRIHLIIFVDYNAQDMIHSFTAYYSMSCGAIYEYRFFADGNYRRRQMS